MTTDDLNAIRQDLALIKEHLIYQEISAAQAAQILGVSEKTVRNKANAGQLPAIPGSKPYRFIKQDIIRRRPVSTHRELCAL